MLFKDIKQNYSVHILNKDKLTLSDGKAITVGFPRYDLTAKSTVVDITLDVNGSTATYAIPESLSVTYAGNLVLSTDKEGLVREIEAMKTSAEQILASVDHQKEVIEKSSALLSELNPQFKEKQETEKRFANIESSVHKIEELVTNFINNFNNK